jgi:hypothetical protein
MSARAELQFTSRACKQGGKHHPDCEGIWEGLGVLVMCECECHSLNERGRGGK